MNLRLDRLYIALLQISLEQLKIAIAEHNSDWAMQEIEFIHNVPSLIGRDPSDANSPNVHFWKAELPAYIGWISRQAEEYKEKYDLFYAPLISEIDKIMIEATNSSRLE